MDPISKSISGFTCDLFKELNRCKKDGNIVCSPLSVTVPLSLLMLGAEGDTASQITKALHLSNQKDATGSPGKPEASSTQSVDECEQKAFKSEKANEATDAHKKIKAVIDKMKSVGDSKLKIVNGLYAQHNFPIKKDYQKSAHELYEAKMENVDFTKDKTRENINKWVETETKGKIQNLFAPSSLPKNSFLAVANAVYFLSKWIKKFKEEDTKDATFHVKEDVKTTVPMMCQRETFHHGVIEEIDAQVIELPYEDHVFSMFIILPNKMCGLQKVTNNLTLELLLKWTNSKHLQEKKLEVLMPRFKIEACCDLTPHLKNMGIVEAFSHKANFSAISQAGLFVSTVIQKALIEVDEGGTVAAAATGAVLVPKSLPQQFKVDHPCVGLIKHNETNVILFCFKLCTPSS